MGQAVSPAGQRRRESSDSHGSCWIMRLTYSTTLAALPAVESYSAEGCGIAAAAWLLAGCIDGIGCAAAVFSPKLAVLVAACVLCICEAPIGLAVAVAACAFVECI